MESVLHESLGKSLWIDGLHNQVFLRVKAIPEIKQYIESVDFIQDIEDSENIMKEFMHKVITLYERFCKESNFESEDDENSWESIQKIFL